MRAVPGIFRTVIAFAAPFFWLMFATGWVFAQNNVPGQPATAILAGTVADPSGAVVEGAVVILGSSATTQRTAITSDTGSFSFSNVRPGTYTVTITASGFTPFAANNVAVSSGTAPPLIAAVLQLATTSEEVTVTLPARELAAEQLKAETKQRLIGVFPNYFVTYEPNPAPLTAAQKFQLGWKSVFDPVPLLLAGVAAGVQQSRNSYPTYGQGAEGYAKRYAANFADNASGILVGRVLMQSIFHQDPRYYYRGTGSFRSRALYAIGTAFVRKGDNGHWQFAYSDVLGGLGSYGISTLYRPGTSRPWMRLSNTVLVNFAGDAANNLFQEFVSKKFTRHAPKIASSEPILRAGTPVTLISVDDLGVKGSADAGPIAFVLASDLRVDGSVVAKAGSKSWGRVTYGSGSGADGEGLHIGLARVRLTIDKVDVPLRGAQVRGNPGVLQYHRLENSGRIAVTLYVDRDTALPPA